MSLWWIAGALLLAFAATLAFRALRFTPREGPAPRPLSATVDAEAAARHLQAMVRCKTVSDIDPAKMDAGEFAAFQALLPRLYPLVHEKCAREGIGAHGLLYTWKGKSGQEPSVFMSHYDVVPANEAEWREPPFSGVIKDGELWGRGTLDTKSTLLGVLEAAESLLREGFVPKNDIYFAFGGDEEVMGQDAPAIVDGVFPGVKRSAAMIGIAEKGSVNVDITATGKGGHASAPPARQSMAVLSRSIQRLAAKSMPFALTKPARELFDVMGRHSDFAFKLIFANLWCFAPLLNLICRVSGGELNALVRTTCAFTRARASEAYNVLPVQAVAGLNLRVICGETIGQITRRLEKTIRDPQVKAEVRQGVEASAISATYDAAWNRLDSAIRQTYPQALVTPYLMLAASDSRHYCRVSDHVYRFSGMPLTKEQRGLIHNADERIPLEHIRDTAAFFIRIMRMS